jgi:DNA-binding SARP family transcriptional activator
MSAAPFELGPLPNVSEIGVRLQLLGGFELWVDGIPIDLSAASQRLVALMAIQAKPIRRALAAGILWPEKSDARANANLRSCLWRLNEPGRRSVVVSRGLNLSLDDGVSLDVSHLERVGWAILHDPTLADSCEAPDLFIHPLLPGWYDDWVVMERERLAQLQARFLEAIVVALVSARKLTRALDHALRLVRADPFREQSQLCLLRVYAAEGSWRQFHQQLTEYEKLLREAFGCGVSSAFRSAAVALTPDSYKSSKGS